MKFGISNLKFQIRRSKEVKMQGSKENKLNVFFASLFPYFLTSLLPFFAGCSGYSNQSLYNDKVRSVYVEMFDNSTFQRDLEYDLTDAIAKRIDAETPYRIISDKSRADSVLSGKITGISHSALTIERQSGRALENQAEVSAEFSWKNLKTGQYLIKSSTASATASYSEFQQQSPNYASKTAANKLAERIVEQMQIEW